MAQRRPWGIVWGMLLATAVANAYGPLGGSGSGSSSNTFFGATLPTLPTQFSTTSNPPTPANTCRGSYYTPGVGGDASLTLQAALNDAAAGGCANGDAVVLQAGTTYTTASNFILPARSGSSIGPVYVISSHAPEIGGSGLPAQGTRVCPIASIGPSCSTTNTSLSDMASIRSSETNTGGPILVRAAGASYYRLVGLDIELADANAEDGANNYVVNFNNGDTSTSTLAQHITIDRCYFDGSPSYGVSHAVDFDGEYMEVLNSYFGEHIWTIGNADTNDTLLINSVGPYNDNNNYFQAGGESTLVGGSDTTLPSPSEPSDITEEHNSFYKNFSSATGSVTASSTTLTVTAVSSGYMMITNVEEDANSYIPANDAIIKQLTGTSGDTCPATDCNGTTGTYELQTAATGTTSGTVAITGTAAGKNMVEFKTGQRVLFAFNYLENAGATGQPRSAFVLTSRNQNGANPWYGLFDFTIEDNFFGNCEIGGLNVLMQDSDADNYATQPADRITIRGNLFLLSQNDGSSDSLMALVSAWGTANNNGDGYDLIVDHNTWIATPSQGAEGYLSLALNLARGVWSNNLLDKSQYGFENNGSPSTWAATFSQVTDGAFVNNVLTGSTDNTVPSGNFAPATESTVGYRSYGSDTSPSGYALSTSSPYHGAGVSGLGLPYTSAGVPDGSDIGADVALLPTS